MTSLFADRVGVIERLLPSQAQLRAKILALIEGLAGGESFSAALERADARFAEIAPYLASSATFRGVITEARTLGAFVRDLKAEDEAFRRGVEGYLEEVVDNKGNRHSLKRYSDRALDRCLTTTRFAGSKESGLPVLTLNIGREFQLKEKRAFVDAPEEGKKEFDFLPAGCVGALAEIVEDGRVEDHGLPTK